MPTATRSRSRPMSLRPPTADIPQRPFGQTGVQVSAIGLGGYHLGLIGSERECISLVHKAIDAGITFMDNAWEYHEGVSEQRMGKALANGRRERSGVQWVNEEGRVAHHFRQR